LLAAVAVVAAAVALGSVPRRPPAPA
jgi:hypothetical protein